MMTLPCRRAVTCGVSLLVFFVAVSVAVCAQPDRDVGSLSGTLTTDDGSAITKAVVSVRGNGGDAIARTDDVGRFLIDGLAPGVYSIRISSLGYNSLSGRTIGVRKAQTTYVALTLARTASSLLTIGRTQTSGSNTLSTSSAPSTTLDSQTYAEQGYTRMSDALNGDISTTLVHPAGGGSTALPTSVALRGPDPTETLIDIDGHQVNNGNTGDFDLSLLDPADYGTIELVKGISPSSLVGPDTIDGAINIRTLEPTTTPQGLLRFSAGSFNSFAETMQSTGTFGRLGYALSLHRATSAGEVNQTILDATDGNAPVQVGSAIDSSTALGNVRYAFGRGGAGYAAFSFRDQSQFRDLSAALSTIAAPGASTSGDAVARRLNAKDVAADVRASPPLLNGFEGTTLQAHNAGYGLDVSTPLGGTVQGGVYPTSLLFRHYTSFVSQSVDGPGADTSPYLYNDRDLIGDDSLELEHQFTNATLTLQYGIRSEILTTDFISGVVNEQAELRRPGDVLDARAQGAGAVTPPGPATSQLGLGQTQRSAVLRYRYDPTASLHLTAAGYYSSYSSFGTSLDPRFGLVYTPDARSVIRFSLGTTFQAPQLPELFVPPVLPIVVGNYISVGNPNLKPDHATEYGLGIEHVFETGARRTDVSLDLYRVNLRTPASIWLPNVDPNCGPARYGGDGTPCPLSYPINAGDAVYQGFELQGERLVAAFTTLRAGYALRSAYLLNAPTSIADGSLVAGEQSLGLPLHKATLFVTHAPPSGFSYFGGLVYEGAYNELNQPPFATLSGGIGYRWRALEVGVSGTNLTNVYARQFTNPGAGVPYAGLNGPIPTDAFAMQGAALNFSVTRRF